MAPDKHEFYYDLDGTVNYRISERWVKHVRRWDWWKAYVLGLIIGAVMVRLWT